MKNDKLRPVAFVLVSSNYGSMIVNRHDYHDTSNGTYGVGFQLLQTSSWNKEEVDLAIQLIETRKLNYGDGVVAIDCGANIGVHTVEWAKHMSGWGNVLAFEAQERIFYALAGNITLNNCFNARAIWSAVGAASGNIGVPVPNYFTPSSFGSLEIKKADNNEYIGQTIDYSEQNLQDTRLIALDDLNMERVDFIKIDVEGMEMDVLAGAEKTISRTKPQLMIEVIKADSAALVQWLTSRGYKTFPSGMNILAIHQTDPVSSQIKVTSFK